MGVLIKVGGRSIPLQRAIALGLADAKGNLLTPAPDSRAAAIIRKEQRQAEWKAKQAGAPKRRTTVRASGTGTEPQTTEDGKIVRRKKEPKALKPQNVTKEGDPITDEETLAEIAAKTAAIEAAKQAAAEAQEN